MSCCFFIKKFNTKRALKKATKRSVRPDVELMRGWHKRKTCRTQILLDQVNEFGTKWESICQFLGPSIY